MEFSTLTLEERERLAYIGGDTKLARMLADQIELEHELDEALDEQIKLNNELDEKAYKS
jgi:hypothetical protein